MYLDLLFCQACGRLLRVVDNKGKKECPRHGRNYFEKPKRKKIGKWSGPSKRYKGGYENE